MIWFEINKEGKAFPSAALRCVLPLLTGDTPVTPPHCHCEKSSTSLRKSSFVIASAAKQSRIEDKSFVSVILVSGLGEGSFLLSTFGCASLPTFCSASGSAKVAVFRRVRERLIIRLQTRERKCLFLGTGIQFKKKKPAATYFPAFAVSSA